MLFKYKLSVSLSKRTHSAVTVLLCYLWPAGSHTVNGNAIQWNSIMQYTRAFLHHIYIYVARGQKHKTSIQIKTLQKLNFNPERRIKGGDHMSQSAIGPRSKELRLPIKIRMRLNFINSTVFYHRVRTFKQCAIGPKTQNLPIAIGLSDAIGA